MLGFIAGIIIGIITGITLMCIVVAGRGDDD